jgi:hypothetical protein
MQHAVRSGSIEVVEWLRQQQGVNIDATVLASAAGEGQTAMCKHLRTSGCEWTVSASLTAVCGGQLGTLRWLVEQGCPWRLHDICVTAAWGNDTDIVDYVLEQGEVLDAELLTEALNWAGSRNNLQAAQWLRQRGAQWPAVLSTVAEPRIQHWSGDILAWARAEG